MKIRLVGQRSVLGGGIHFFNFSDALKKYNFISNHVEEIDVTNVQALQRMYASSQDADITVFFSRPKLPGKVRGAVVKWAIFESNKLPEYYINYLSDADVMWTPSGWAKEILIQSGLISAKIDVVPEGVDAAVFHPFLGKSLKKDGVFRFLMIGKYEKRKGYQELIDGFADAFGNNPDVRLVIKSDYFLNHEEKKMEIINYVGKKSLNNVNFVWGNVDGMALFALYNYCDCFIFPSRAEGWGLPLIEAVASGLPVIATNYSGHSQFLSAIPGLFVEIPFLLKNIEDEDFKKFWPSNDGDFGQWAVTEPKVITALLQEMKNNFKHHKEQAFIASEVIRSTFSWDRSASIAMKSLFQRSLIDLKLNIQMG